MLITIIIAILVIHGLCIYFVSKKRNPDNLDLEKIDYEIGHTWEADYFGKNGCPFCKNNDGWVEGPSGGMCVNFWCPNCGARFNHMGFFGIELTGKPDLEY